MSFSNIFFDELTNAEAGTERVCLRSSRWDIDVIEEQLDSFESVLRSMSVGSKAKKESDRKKITKKKKKKSRENATIIHIFEKSICHLL